MLLFITTYKIIAGSKIYAMSHLLEGKWLCRSVGFWNIENMKIKQGMFLMNEGGRGGSIYLVMFDSP